MTTSPRKLAQDALGNAYTASAGLNDANNALGLVKHSRGVDPELSLDSCNEEGGDDEASRSQLHDGQGVPVNVRQVVRASGGVG